MKRRDHPVHHLSARLAVGNALRRRVWRWFFAKRNQAGFYSDTSDHIGVERLISGDLYEFNHLHALDRIIKLCGLGSGLAVDVGANIGNHACWLTKRFDRVVCIEPSEVASSVLRANLLMSGTDNWEIIEGALGDRNARGVLDTVNRRNLGSSQVRVVKDREGDFSISTGDDLLAERTIPVQLIKADVEGQELAVLEGFSKCIAKWAPLICVEALDEASWQDLREYLEGKGYSTFKVLESDDDGSLLARARLIVRGRSWHLVDMPRAFPASGYPMVFCLTEKYAGLVTH